MRFARKKEVLTSVSTGMLLAIAVAFPVVNYGQQSQQFIQFDASTGLARNPMQAIGSGSHWTSASSLKGWGHAHMGRNALEWRGTLQREVYKGQPDANQSRLALHMGILRVLNEHVETGLSVDVSHGTDWARNLRFREEWHAFTAGHWGGRWWMALRNEGRVGRISIEKQDWTYVSNMGFDRGEFTVRADVRLPVMTRVRGQVRLNKIGQQRTHHLADLVFELDHQETQFRNWALSEGPVGSAFNVRSAALAATGGMWEGNRMWTETEGSVRLELTEYRGVSGGVQMAWRHRIDAVRGTYDEDRSLYGMWIAAAQTDWAAKARCTWNAVHSSGLAVYSETGWDTYRHKHIMFDGRLERTIRGGVGAFIAGEIQIWRSNALPVGWYQRSDWSSGWIRCGLVWQASTASRSERSRALKRRMAFE